MTERRTLPNYKLASWVFLENFRVVRLQALVQVSRHGEGPATAEVENPHR